jgi:predicted component of viral defense system (DUF524 family)
MVNSDDFKMAILRVINSPITRWKTENEYSDSRRVKRITSSHIKQFASGSNRIALSKRHSFGNNLDSIPKKLNTVIKTDTLDNPENRFIKHALTEFARFTGSVCEIIEESKKTPKPNIYSEAKNLQKKLSEWLNHNTFREVSQVKTLPLNNPVLQRKEGYREIFRIWLMYDLAAKLSWKGLDPDTYNTGKRDVATLYEYWMFFKLLRMVEEIFEIPPLETKKLIQNDGLVLQLKAGKHTAIEGLYVHNNRKLKIKYNYNRTFSYADFPRSGSWTQQMRPDYTISFWPADFSETEAEEQELIVHIHFDAKYKVEDLKYILNNDKQNSNAEDSDELNIEKELEKTGKYKRADLLKMHAYKDAIRRTAGAYVIYPGSINSTPYKGFHELIPGLGAFAVSPSDTDDGINEVKSFILKILDHFTNRSTLRETHSFYTYKIMNNMGKKSIHESIPEYIDVLGTKIRSKPALEIIVLVGYIQEKQKDWVLKNGFYNIRIDKEITPEIAGADYLLLYDGLSGNKIQFWKNGLFKIKNNPVIRSRNWLLDLEYPEPRKPEYFIYEIDIEIVYWSKDKVAEIALKENEEKYRPIIRILPDLLF